MPENLYIPRQIPALQGHGLNGSCILQHYTLAFCETLAFCNTVKGRQGHGSVGPTWQLPLTLATEAGLLLVTSVDSANRNLHEPNDPL